MVERIELIDGRNPVTDPAPGDVWRAERGGEIRVLANNPTDWRGIAIEGVEPVGIGWTDIVARGAFERLVARYALIRTATREVAP